MQVKKDLELFYHKSMMGNTALLPVPVGDSDLLNVTWITIVSMKLEFLALKWAVTEKFCSYLLGAEFEVLTDNNPLSHLETVKLGAVEQRWASQLALFNFKITYKPGKNNQNADALSRMSPKPQTVTENPKAAVISTSSVMTTLATLAMSTQIPPEIATANGDGTCWSSLNDKQYHSYLRMKLRGISHK